MERDIIIFLAALSGWILRGLSDYFDRIGRAGLREKVRRWKNDAAKVARNPE